MSGGQPRHYWRQEYPFCSQRCDRCGLVRWKTRRHWGWAVEYANEEAGRVRSMSRCIGVRAARHTETELGCERDAKITSQQRDATKRERSRRVVRWSDYL